MTLGERIDVELASYREQLEDRDKRIEQLSRLSRRLKRIDLYFNTAQAANILDVSVATVIKYARCGALKLHPTSTPRHVRLSAESVLSVDIKNIKYKRI